MNLGLHEMLRSSSVAEQLAASRERFSLMELVGQLEDMEGNGSGRN
jgi:hypothetical protein